MPRLGTGGEPSVGGGGGGSPQRRPAASAYPSGAMRGGFFTNFIFLLGFTFILRNMIFKVSILWYLIYLTFFQV